MFEALLHLRYFGVFTFLLGESYRTSEDLPVQGLGIFIAASGRYAVHFGSIGAANKLSRAKAPVGSELGYVGLGLSLFTPLYVSMEYKRTEEFPSTTAFRFGAVGLGLVQIIQNRQATKSLTGLTSGEKRRKFHLVSTGNGVQLVSLW